MSLSQSLLPEERSTPEKSSRTWVFSVSLCKSSSVMTSGLPSNAYRKPM